MSDRPSWLDDLTQAAGSLKAAKTSLTAATEKASAEKRVAELLLLYELEVEDIHFRVAGLKAAQEP